MQSLRNAEFGFAVTLVHHYELQNIPLKLKVLDVNELWCESIDWLSTY